MKTPILNQSSEVYRRLLLTAGLILLIASATPTAFATLINVGDAQNITLLANVNGDPATNPAWAYPISVTAGTYEFVLLPSSWSPVASGIPFVGGARVLSNDLTFQYVVEPMAPGTNINATTDVYDFTVPTDQTLLAGVSDNVLRDNSGTLQFSLTKTGNLQSVPEDFAGLSLPLLIAMFLGLAALSKKLSPGRGQADRSQSQMGQSIPM